MFASSIHAYGTTKRYREALCCRRIDLALHVFLFGPYFIYGSGDSTLCLAWRACPGRRARAGR